MKSKGSSLRRSVSIILSAIATTSIGVGLFAAVRSPLFLVQVVEISDLPDRAPLSAQAITDLAKVPLGKVSLFQFDLSSVERRVLASPWIKEVRIQRRFPQTLSISVTFREPKALFMNGAGTLSYVDSDGTVFGRAGAEQAQLPVLSGTTDAAKIREGLRLVSRWD